MSIDSPEEHAKCAHPKMMKIQEEKDAFEEGQRARWKGLGMISSNPYIYLPSSPQSRAFQKGWVDADKEGRERKEFTGSCVACLYLANDDKWCAKLGVNINIPETAYCKKWRKR